MAKSDDSSLSVQLRSFIGIGVFTALIDWTITMTLQYFGLHRNVAKALGWVVGTISAYFLNSKFTFRTAVNAKKAGAVAMLYASTFLVQNVLYGLSDPLLQAIGMEGLLKDTVAFIIAQAVATLTNFAIQRLVIFRVK